MISLSPTIIVGLGSYGGKVVSTLRTLVYEELGVAGLPIFRFMHISTHKNAEIHPEPSNAEGTHIWEMLHILPATMDTKDLQTAKKFMKAGAKENVTEPGWKEWLDKDVFELPETSYLMGAANTRMIGRACLWSNWNRNTKIKIKLDDAIQQIQKPKAFEETSEVLNEYIARKKGRDEDRGFDVTIDRNPTVYIVGSLCGGTGAGMFIDIAYYFRQLGDFNVFGMFSIPDERGCTGGTTRIAENAFASLKELDFYYHNKTKYSAHLPATKPVDTNDIPFNYFQVVSPTSMGKIKGTFQIGPKSKIDENTIQELQFICAISLFFDIIGGTASTKIGMHINFHARDDAWREGKDYLKCLSSFGAAAAHYPKYKIAGAAACRLLQGKFYKWIGKIVDRSESSKGIIKEKHKNIQEMEQLAKNWFNQAYSKSRGVLDLKHDGNDRTLKEEWVNEYEDFFSARSEIMNSDQLEKRLLSFPTDSPFSKRFTTNGKYARQIRDRIPKFIDKMIKEIKDKFDENIDVIIGGGNIDQKLYVTSLLELQGVAESMSSGVIASLIEEIKPVSSESVSGKTIKQYIDEYNRVINSKAITFTMMSHKVGSYYQREIIKQFQIVLEKEYNKMVTGCIGEDLPSLKEKLKTHINTPITRLIQRLNNCHSHLRDVQDNMLKTKEWDHLKILSKHQDETLEADIQYCVNQFINSDWKSIFNTIESKSTNHDSIKSVFLDQDQEIDTILKLITGHVSRQIMPVIDQSILDFDIIKELIRYHPTQLTRLAERSDVLVDTNENYSEIADPDFQLSLICGGSNNNTLTELTKHLNINDNDKFDSVSKINTTMDQMLLFYMEESGISLEELTVFDTMEDLYDQALGTNIIPRRLVHTHKDSKTFAYELYRRAETLTLDFAEGRPSIFKIATQFIFDDIFEEQPSLNNDAGVVYQFNWHENGRRMNELYDPDNPEGFIWELVTSKSGYEEFKKQVRYIVTSKSNDQINDRWQEIHDNYDKSGDRVKLNKFKKSFSPDFTDRVDFPWWDA